MNLSKALLTSAVLALGFSVGVHAADTTPGEKGTIRRMTTDTVNKVDEVTSDSWITSKVKSSYFTDGDLSGFEISVHTQDGVVTLSGDVDSEAHKAKAIRIAQGIDGVKSVDGGALRASAR